MIKITGLLFSLLISSIVCWETLPQIPSGRRSQYLVLHESGGYKYGYDTGDGSAAEQSGDDFNQVEGRYLYDSPSGKKISVKYTAGVQGFIPEGFSAVAIPDRPAQPLVTLYSSSQENDDEQTGTGTGDASYSFTIDTDSYQRQEASDERGNVKGSYTYNNDSGRHDLTYIAGENTGFLPISGSLATPNGLKTDIPRGHSILNENIVPVSITSSADSINADGSYSYGYTTSDASHQQAGDANNNVKGSFSYRNSAGTHDLSYVAGSSTGFLPTGGSLAQPNGLNGQANPLSNLPVTTSLDNLRAISSHLTPADGSYSFEYSTDDSSRRELGDANGNVHGSYSYRNQAGNHDLSYSASPSTGFQVTGGSLSVPNGLGNSNPNNVAPISPNSIQESPSVNTNSFPLEKDLANTGDSSYSFTIDTDNYKRTETSDASGNVQGRYSYTNSAGTHDLSFVAGSDTGFQPTGGSLSNPNTILPSLSRSSLALPLNGNGEQSAGDASYNFSVDTDEYKRTESSDASGNVVGSFSYRNSAGTHDLSYEAGAEKGFRTTGGFLSIAPGLTEAQLRSGESSQQPYTNRSPTGSTSSVGKTSYSIGNVVVNSYLPPSNEKRKFGYIFDSKY